MNILLFTASYFACSGDSEQDSKHHIISYELEDSCHPLSIVGECFLPFPSMHFTVEDQTRLTGVHLAYETDYLENPNGISNFDLNMFNIADGVSPLSPMAMNFGVDIDPSYLSGAGAQEETVQQGAAIAVVNLSTGERIPVLTEMDQANREWSDYDARHPLIIRPLAPMNFGERYMVVLSNELRDVNGNALPRSEVFDLFQQEQYTDNDVIEEMRERYEGMFEVAQNGGWNRDDILLMWDFQVASEEFVLGPIKSIKEQVLSQDASSFSFEISEQIEDPNDNLSWFVKGTFYPPNFLSDNELSLDHNYLPIEQTERMGYNFHMVVPKNAKQQGNLKLILIGHGLFGTGSSMLESDDPDHILYAWANDMNAVLIATDWIGLSGGDRDLIISEVLPDLNRVRVVTDRLVQSHANNLALVEMALTSLTSNEVLPVVHDEPLIDENQIFYYGISLGGIQGAGTTTISDRISRSVLAVPGAGWAHLIQRSTQFQPLELMFDNLYPDPLTQTLLLGAVQGFFDWSDPGNLTRIDNNSEKIIVLQEAIGDCQVANITTNLLSRSIGAHHLEYATDPVFGLETVSAPYQGIGLTQIRVEDALDNFFPPDANITPEIDNGVHNTAVLRESIFSQIEHLYQYGELIHPCEGECDPD